MKSVVIKNLPGYRPGAIASFPDNKAITYCQNGQASPNGWSLEKQREREMPEAGQPINRMLNTGSDLEKTKAPKRKKDTD